ncbi:MAG: threonine--tRNA ligase [Fusobacteriaceae bacterium]|nr:threonine--tRNA ligase [Fusobacteriaceae bacterium]MBP6466529.1 threonine--tRNA ligase [Fusobacteriaceae bacterium]MBP9596636.1 threonine--tRNA ligase [Fusobacteriaceae bacterium]MBU9917116.1 threonine--tRNA ligase [Fusobacteriaceae bacterium]
MINIMLPSGDMKQFENSVNMFDIAKSISNSLAKKAIGARVDGKLVDMTYVVEKDAKVELVTPETEDGVEIIRHSTAHLMAQAVIRLFPGTKVSIGPSIDKGFYYDFDPLNQFSEEDLIKIENEMKNIAKEDIKIVRHEITREDAIEKFKAMGENYKVEIIESIPVGEILSLYEQGEFIDLCRGPHVPSTRYLKAFKLTKVAGAYWRGDSKNKMLQRIYGYAFAEERELKEYLVQLEEAEKRDHRKLGKELELFFMSDYGPGFPFFLPKGMELKNTLMRLWEKEHKKSGYKMIQTPIMLNKELWETSGHWFNYRENMYTSEIDELEFAIKPMNCPGCMLAYKNGLHSYKDLPLRMGEFGHVHRHEFSGALHGLFRVRAFTQDDAHVFMTPSQMQDEVIKIIDLYDKFYTLFGLSYHIELSTRPENSIGDVAIWEMSEKTLADAITASGRTYKLNPGDGAFYGPKLDFKLKDAIGRIWQCGTIQLDMNLPERFDLSYIGEDGEKHRPIMLHRAMYGSIERFTGILIEHYAGAFPFWLAPVQVKVLTITDDQIDYAKEIQALLEERGIKVELDTRAEKIGYKIREANGKYKIPVQLVLGKAEIENRTVNVRRFGSQDQTSMSLDEFLKMVEEENKVKF